MQKGQPNFSDLANSYKIKGITVKNTLEMDKVFKTYKEYSNALIIEFIVVDNENCYPMVSPGGTNVAMAGITYQSNELEILQRYTETDSNLDEFLSIKTEESKAAERISE